MTPTASAIAEPMLPEWYRVLGNSADTHNVQTLELSPADDGAPASFSPGQYNMLYVFGVGEVPISISGDPTAGGPLVHTIAAVGAVTRALCALSPGDVVGLRGPFGRGWPLEVAEGGDLLLMAGGIGLAPLRPALYQVLAQRERFGRVTLLYGTRSPEDLLFEAELRRWGGRFDLDVEVTVDQAKKQWHGSVGVVTNLLNHVQVSVADTTCFVCGPEIMLRASARQLESMGLPEQRLFLSAERNMKCALGRCGRCQLGEHFVCKDGPVFPYAALRPLFQLR